MSNNPKALTKAQLISSLAEAEHKMHSQHVKINNLVSDRDRMRGTLEDSEANALNRCVVALETMYDGDGFKEAVVMGTHDDGYALDAVVRPVPASDCPEGRILLYLAARFNVDLTGRFVDPDGAAGVGSSGVAA